MMNSSPAVMEEKPVVTFQRALEHLRTIEEGLTALPIADSGEVRLLLDQIRSAEQVVERLAQQSGQ